MPKETEGTYLPSMARRRLQVDRGVFVVGWFKSLRESLEGDMPSQVGGAVVTRKEVLGWVSEGGRC